MGLGSYFLDIGFELGYVGFLDYPSYKKYKLFKEINACLSFDIQTKNDYRNKLDYD